MQTLAQGLSADIYVDNNSLRTPSNTRPAIGHRDGSYFGGAGDEAWPAVGTGALAGNDGFDYRRVVGADVNEASRYTGFPERFDDGEGGGVSRYLSVE
jgi:hypothetical protein